MSNARITVLGSNGFIGSHLLRHLQCLGQTCTGPSRDDPAIFTRDLGRVIYTIGLTADFRTRPLDTVEAHVCLLQRLIQTGNFESLTYLSSTRVYAGATDTSETAQLLVNPNHLSDLYNLSKLMGESLCLHGGHSGMKVVRLSNIVGLRPDPDIFIDQLLEEGCCNGKVEFRTALDSKKDYLYIDDAVDMLTRITLSSETGIFNLASGEGVENREIAEALEKEMGFAISVIPDAPFWEFQTVNISKIKTQFGFTPQKFSAYFPQFLKLYRQSKGI